MATSISNDPLFDKSFLIPCCGGFRRRREPGRDHLLGPMNETGSGLMSQPAVFHLQSYLIARQLLHPKSAPFCCDTLLTVCRNEKVGCPFRGRSDVEGIRGSQRPIL